MTSAFYSDTWKSYMRIYLIIPFLFSTTPSSLPPVWIWISPSIQSLPYYYFLLNLYFTRFSHLQTWPIRANHQAYKYLLLQLFSYKDKRDIVLWHIFWSKQILRCSRWLAALSHHSVSTALSLSFMTPFNLCRVAESVIMRIQLVNQRTHAWSLKNKG